MCIRIGAELSCKVANLLVLLTPLRAAGAQDVEFVSIPEKNIDYLSKVLYNAISGMINSGCSSRDLQ